MKCHSNRSDSRGVAWKKVLGDLLSPLNSLTSAMMRRTESFDIVEAFEWVERVVGGMGCPGECVPVCRGVRTELEEGAAGWTTRREKAEGTRRVPEGGSDVVERRLRGWRVVDFVVD